MIADVRLKELVTADYLLNFQKTDLACIKESQSSLNFRDICLKTYNVFLHMSQYI